MSDQDAWTYAQEMRLDPYNNVEPPRPTLQEWVKNVQIEGGRTPYLPPSTEWEPGRFERPDPNKMPASPFAYNPFRDMQRAPETTPQLPSGDDLSQFLTRQPPRTNLPPTPSPRTSPPAATPPPGNDLSEFLTQQPPRNAELPPTPKTNTPAPIPGETPQGPRATPQSPTTARIPPTGAGTPPPPPAAPRVAIPPNNPTPGARPSNVPAPRGAGPIAGGAIAAVADFGWRTFNGQDPKTAAGGAIVGVGGSIAGSVIGGMIGGPVGSFVGGMAGGYIASAIYNNATAPKPASPQIEPYVGPAPFTGGQCPTLYQGGIYYKFRLTGSTATREEIGRFQNITGPITDVRLTFLDNQWRYEIKAIDAPTSYRRTADGWFEVGALRPGAGTVISIKLVELLRQDGRIDNCGNPAPLPVPKDDRTPDSTYHPGNVVYVPYPYTPDRPKEAPPTNYVPGGIGTRTGGTPRGDSPNWIPHGSPAGSPHPNTAPPPVAPMPAPVSPGSPSAATGASPSDAPAPNRHGGDVRFEPDTGRVIFTTPGSPTSANPRANPNEQAIPPAFEANPIAANPIKQSGGLAPTGFTNTSTPAQPAGLPQTGKQEPTQDANRDYPLAPQPQLQPQPQPQTQQTEQRITQLEDKIDEIAIGLVTLTQLFNPIPGQLTGIQNNTTPQAIQNAAANGTCQTLQPGGCMLPVANNAANAANRSNDAARDAANNGRRLQDLINAADAAQGADTNTRVRNIENRVGANEYPMVLPEYLLDEFLDRQVVINNQIQYNAWLLKQIDALVGLFPIKIERTDEDGKKETLIFENIAEAIAELTGLLAQIAFDADTAVNVATRATGEALGAKAASIQAGSYLKAIIDYLGFQTQDIAIDVPISVTPGAVGRDGKLQESELKDFLQPSTQRTIGAKNIDPVDQRLVMQRVLQNTEIARHALYKPLKPFQAGDNRITGDAIKEDRKKEREQANARWEAFKRRMEGHTAGTRIDIDDGTNSPNSTNNP